jgi:uncharacterized membrane protein YGL010W
MTQYDHEHTNALNKVLHGIGIPIILAGIVFLILTFWRIGLALFVGGWALLFLGHRIEGNKPAFFQGRDLFPRRAGLGCQGNQGRTARQVVRNALNRDESGTRSEAPAF